MKAYAAKFLLLILVLVPFKSDARIGADVEVQEDRSLYYNRGGNRNYYGGYYQRRRYYYYQKYYGGNNNVDNVNDNNVDDTYDNNVDDNQGDDNGVDDQVYNDGDADDYIATYAENNGTDADADWYTRIVNAEKQFETDLKTWYYTPPGEWTAQEWGLFGGLAAILVGTLFCFCMCCCYSGGDKSYITRQRASSTYDFDDYTSIDSRKASSSSSSGSSTESDDSATYDSIMRLRSD
jgi:hypothetical protein